MLGLWEEQTRPFDGRLWGYDVPLVAAWVRDPGVQVFMERLSRDYLPMAETGDYLVFMQRTLAARAFPGGRDAPSDARDPTVAKVPTSESEVANSADALPGTTAAGVGGASLPLGAFRDLDAMGTP